MLQTHPCTLASSFWRNIGYSVVTLSNLIGLLDIYHIINQLYLVRQWKFNQEDFKQHYCREEELPNLKENLLINVIYHKYANYDGTNISLIKKESIQGESSVSKKCVR